MIVEADAFKENDVIYKTIKSRGHHDDMLQTAELVWYASAYVILLLSLYNVYALNMLIKFK